MSDIYCGAKNVPKGKRLGSMKECVEKKQISYYGVKKVDSRLLETLRNPKKGKDAKGNKMSLEKVAGERGTLQAKVKKIGKQIDAEKNAKKKKELEKTRDDLKKKLADTIKLFNQINKSQKRQSRSQSKSRSRSHKSARSCKSRKSCRSRSSSRYCKSKSR